MRFTVPGHTCCVRTGLQRWRIFVSEAPPLNSMLRCTFLLKHWHLVCVCVFFLLKICIFSHGFRHINVLVFYNVKNLNRNLYCTMANCKQPITFYALDSCLMRKRWSRPQSKPDSRLVTGKKCSDPVLLNGLDQVQLKLRIIVKRNKKNAGKKKNLEQQSNGMLAKKPAPSNWSHKF